MEDISRRLSRINLPCWIPVHHTDDRTPRRTDIFLSLVSVSHLIAVFTHTLVRVAQVKLVTWLGRVAYLRAFFKVIRSYSIFHRPLLDLPDPFPTVCSAPPPSTLNSLLMTGIRRPSCATPPGRILFGHLTESFPLTGHESKICIDVSSEHTPINYPSRSNSFNIENNDLATTVAASERTPTVFISKRQPAVALSLYQQVR